MPIVIKANTSIKGLVTSNGWKGYSIPGHELLAPADATVVAKLRGAGAVIVGQTNMPDFAASDTTNSTAGGRTGNAYNWRFSPGGSSGGTVTSVAGNFAVFGTGTDTSNSIRMPSGTSNVVGVLPTRGLVSIAGIHPLDWLLDDTGPITRTVTDAAIALSVMAGEDAKDFRTRGSAAKAEPGPYTNYLKRDGLKGKRFGVPAFILNGTDTPFQGIPGLGADAAAGRIPLRPETRAAFMKAIEGLRAAGAAVVFDNSILPDSYAKMVNKVRTLPSFREGTENSSSNMVQPNITPRRNIKKQLVRRCRQLLSAAPPPLAIPRLLQRRWFRHWSKSIRRAEVNVVVPRRQALDAYTETLDRIHFDGFVYPATQMPPPDEIMPQDGAISGGPHSDTGWVTDIGVPAVVVPGGFYDDGLPFGRNLVASVEGRRSHRLGLRIRTGNEAPQAAHSG